MSYKELRRIPQTNDLRKIMYFERALLGLTGGWICRLPHLEAKYMVARHQYEWAEHVNVLRKRLTEMPGGKPDGLLTPALQSIIDECLFAPDDKPFLEVLYTILLPFVRDAYRAYSLSSNELPDRPTIFILKDVDQTLNQQIDQGLTFMKATYGTPGSLDRWAVEKSVWAKHIQHLLDSAGGIYGQIEADEIRNLRHHAGQTYHPPEQQVREEHVHLNYHFQPIAGYDPQVRLKGEVDIERVVLAVWLYNEIDAAEVLPTLFYEMKGMPWEFYYDLARHSWDEARHSEFGYKLLQMFDFKPEEFEFAVGTYMGIMKLKPHERYALIACVFEPKVFTMKPDYLERLADDAGESDALVELMRFDLADETNHVRYGNRWVKELMKLHGEQEDLQVFLDRILQKVIEVNQELHLTVTPTMPAEQRHNFQSVKKRMAEWKQKKANSAASL
ncbi:MAG TPA: DUF455 family protein [Bacilli bacterium]